ncbi:MAG: Flp pilus assembly complex ATPase component TadA [Syntrophomonadaceae bacterium]|nr:Flp pilus assembly complex ATPase component TadA [Syntrophomonadaceae bacterium]
MKRKVIGEILLEMGLITPEQQKSVLEEQAKTKEKFGAILLKKGILTEQQLMEILEFRLGIPQVQLSKMDIDPDVIKLLPPQLIRLHKVLPISRRKNILTLAMADPLNQQAIEDVRMATNMDVVPVLASEKDMDTAIRQYLAFRLDPKMENIVNELGLDGKANAMRLKELQNMKLDEDAPVIRMVNSILVQAVQGRCSDIHIEPQEKDLRVRFRVDGELYEVLSLPQLSQAAVISRIKISANMDIAEKRVPQDGRFRMVVDGREVDFRVSTLPTALGEKAVLRILDRGSALTRVDQLGLSPLNKEYLLSLSRRPHGMLLVTGPTGSGKTTTLYSVLGEVNSVDKNIITLEDPIEYTLAGINQVQINLRAGLTFASGLRSILRQDPDIIMVGEIRDQETAQLAVQAALTGHLVLSTLHTNSAAGTIARIKDMGIEDFLLASSLSGIVSQRLVRQLCPNCKEKYNLAEETASKLGMPEESGHEFYRPVGCNMCRQLGYQGRIALHEIMVVGPRVRELINRGENSEDEIEATARREGMVTIREDGMEKARQGKTSLEEVLKVVLLEG